MATATAVKAPVQARAQAPREITREQLVVKIVEHYRALETAKNPAWTAVKQDDVIRTMQAVAAKKGQELTVAAAKEILEPMSSFRSPEEGRPLVRYWNTKRDGSGGWMTIRLVTDCHYAVKNGQPTRYDDAANAVLKALASLV